MKFYKFIEAIENNHWVEFYSLYKNKDVNPANNNNWAIKLAAEKNRYDMLNILIKDKRINPASQDNWAIRTACKLGHLESLKVLLNHPLVKFQKIALACLKNAVHYGHHLVVEFIKNRYEVDLGYNQNLLLRLAIQKGHELTALSLMRDKRINPAEFNNAAVKTAIVYNQLNILKKMNNDYRVNLDFEDYWTIKNSAHFGHQKMFNYLADLFFGKLYKLPESLKRDDKIFGMFIKKDMSSKNLLSERDRYSTKDSTKEDPPYYPDRNYLTDKEGSGLTFIKIGKNVDKDKYKDEDEDFKTDIVNLNDSDKSTAHDRHKSKEKVHLTVSPDFTV